ncbi:hypothetical protein ACFL24_01810 [Patescibacteria group bacterium]
MTIGSNISANGEEWYELGDLIWFFPNTYLNEHTMCADEDENIWVYRGQPFKYTRDFSSEKRWINEQPVSTSDPILKIVVNPDDTTVAIGILSDFTVHLGSSSSGGTNWTWEASPLGNWPPVVDIAVRWNGNNPEFIWAVTTTQPNNAILKLEHRGGKESLPAVNGTLIGDEYPFDNPQQINGVSSGIVENVTVYNDGAILELREGMDNNFYEYSVSPDGWTFSVIGGEILEPEEPRLYPCWFYSDHFQRNYLLFDEFRPSTGFDILIARKGDPPVKIKSASLGEIKAMFK